MHARLAVFGFGNMGQAVVAGATHEGLLAPADIVVIEPDAEKREAARRAGCGHGDHPSAARTAEQVLLAVKPQVFPELAPALADRAGRSVFISVMAGISSERIRAAIGGDHGVVRAMPNVACKFRKGMTGLALAAGSRAGDDEFATRLFASLGHVAHVEESMLDAVTAVSGSGPAYLFLLAEAWEAAATDLGFDATTARDLVRQTIVGAAHMLADRAMDAADLRAAVTSKGGTTAAAIAVLEASGMRDAMRDAVRAAQRRGRELGG
ncbi:MAG: pyrroline-5-carboxylate reductase [Phycisphaerales bacterium]